jgi:hypothetical protein
MQSKRCRKKHKRVKDALVEMPRVIVQLITDFFNVFEGSLLQEIKCDACVQCLYLTSSNVLLVGTAVATIEKWRIDSELTREGVCCALQNIDRIHHYQDRLLAETRSFTYEVNLEPFACERIDGGSGAEKTNERIHRPGCGGRSVIPYDPPDPNDPTQQCHCWSFGCWMTGKDYSVNLDVHGNVVTIDCANEPSAALVSTEFVAIAVGSKVLFYE